MKKFYTFSGYFQKHATTPFLILCLLFLNQAQAQTNLLTQGFESLPFPPTGWQNVRITGPSLPGNWARFGNGVSPVQTPHTGSWQVRYNSHNYGAGTSGDLRTSVLDFTTAGTYTVSFWMFRDNWIANDKLEVYVNTTQTSVGGTLLGTINRDRNQSPNEAANGWYQYSFTIPPAFNTAVNYVIFKATSGFGNDIYMDDISIDRLAPAVPGCIGVFSPASGAAGECTNETLEWGIAATASGYKITMGNNAPDYNNIANNLDIGVALSYNITLLPSTTYGWKITPYNGYGDATGCTTNTFTTGTGVCYCTPVYLESSCGTEDFIDDFSTTGGTTNISNDNSGCAPNPNNFTFFSTKTVTAMQGNSINMSMQSGPEFSEGFGVWVDWNIDGDFDDAGEYAYGSPSATTAVVNGSLMVPYTATPGTTRMRVRCAFNYVPLTGQACLTLNEGETEDYNFQVTPCPTTTYYADADADTYGNPLAPIASCFLPEGYVLDNTDCNDMIVTVNPGKEEVCNGIDDNCNASTDEGLTFVVYYADADADTYGNNAVTQSACDGAPVGYVENNTDCNDGNTAIYPGAIEICNSIDDDCDVTIDEGAATSTITPAGPTTFCKPGTVILQANTGAGYIYQWMRNGGNIAGATSANYTTNKTGSYQVKVTVPGGCMATSAITAVSVLASPTATISTPDGTDLCGLANVRLKATNGAGFTWVWYKNNVVIAGATSQTYFATAIGNYKVKVTAPTGCSKTSPATMVTKSCREIDDLQSNAIMNIYPNPAADRATVYVLYDGSYDEATIECYDMMGNIVLSLNTSTDHGTLTKEIDLAQVPSGIYLVKINIGTQQFTQQMVISK